MAHKFLITGLTILSLIGCDKLRTNEIKAIKTEEIYISDSCFQSQQFGDSLRIETIVKGDTIIKHYIDLKGVTDDNFDNSYTALCVYKSKKNDTMMNSSYFITLNEYKFYFDTLEVLNYCDSLMSLNRNEKKEYYRDLKQSINQKGDKSIKIGFLNGFERDLLINFRPKIIDRKTQKAPRALLIESYRTDFSGGKNFYIIKNQGDTILLFHDMEYIR
jgi:hypothetical protein